MSQIAYLSNVNSPLPLKNISIDEMLAEIKNGTHRALIEALPDKHEEPDNYKTEKTKLPAYVPCGTFTGEVTIDNFLKSSGYAILDIDGIPAELAKIYRDTLGLTCPWIKAIWLSPSGYGIKILVHVGDGVKSDTDNKRVFDQLRATLKKQGIAVDKTGKDVARKCFVSHDPDIFINPAPTVYPVVPAPPTKTAPPRHEIPVAIPKPNDVIIGLLCRYLQSAVPGTIHRTRYNIARLAGGYVASGQVDETAVLTALYTVSHAICDQYGDSENRRAIEYRTITSGFEEGRASPVYPPMFDAVLPEDFIARIPGEVLTAAQYLDILDADETYCKVDLLHHLSPSHIMRRMAVQIAAQTRLPPSTVLLVGLGIVSAMLARKYSIAYRDGRILPVGLYVIVEQPSATAKTFCTSMWQEPFFNIADFAREGPVKNMGVFRQRKALKEVFTEADLIRHEADLKLLHTIDRLFITNATPEALESSLEGTGGYFAAISSEQGLLNSLLGGSYNGDAKTNNDVILAGYGGDRTASLRVTREGYRGRITGGVVCFAQDGSIKTVLDKSEGTGLAERCLMLAEESTLGTRKHTQFIRADKILENEYSVKCGFIRDVFENPKPLKELDVLTITDHGFFLINTYRDTIEKELADGGLYSHVSLRGTAGKIDMAIMKIASVLHCMNSAGLVIDDECVKVAISVADNLLKANRAMCVDKGIIGQKAEWVAVIDYLSANGSKSEVAIVNALKNRKPFSEMTGGRNKAIRLSLSEMLKVSIIYKLGSAYYFTL